MTASVGDQCVEVTGICALNLDKEDFPAVRVVQQQARLLGTQWDPRS